MIIGNRRNSWQLWENYSHVAVDIGNISQVCASFISFVKTSLICNGILWRMKGIFGLFHFMLYALYAIICMSSLRGYFWTGREGINSSALKWNMIILIIIVLFKIWWMVRSIYYLPPLLTSLGYRMESTYYLSNISLMLRQFYWVTLICLR
jgi:hypothetical protein